MIEEGLTLQNARLRAAIKKALQQCGVDEPEATALGRVEVTLMRALQENPEPK